MKTVKRVFVMLLCIALTVVLPACGCEHEWMDATCLAPKTCSLCGETSGGIGEHDYVDATCTSPKRCVCCGETVGKALEHYYINGDCIRCLQPDPNYVDLNKFGFANMHGMTMYLVVSGYDFGNNKVFTTGYFEKPSFDFIAFYGNYMKSGWILKSNLVTATSVTIDLFDSSSTTLYNLISNDVISYDSGWGSAPATIVERVVDSKNSKLVLKIIHEDWDSDEEYWLVPTDLLDFSTIELYKKNENNSSYAQYSVNFK